MSGVAESLAIAVRHHQEGRLQAAEQLYREILAAAPDHADALNFLGAICHQTGRLNEAFACWRRFAALKPDLAAAHYNLGLACKDLGKLDDAAACWRRAIEIQPNEPAAHNNLGNVLRELGRLDEATGCYRRAVDLQPGVARPHYNLGNALRDQGKLDEAAASYRRALELAPDYVEALSNLGNVLRRVDKSDQAIACWRRVVQLRPDFAEAHFNLGIACADQEDFSEAIVCCRRAVLLKPDFAEAHSTLGNALRELGALDEAVGCCRKAIELEPGLVEAHNNLGNTLKDRGESEAAIACYLHAAELQPDNADAPSRLGNVLKEQGKLDEALACYRRALELRPDFAECLGSLGSLLEEKADFAAAEDSFRAAVRHNSRAAFSHYKLAELLRGKLDEPEFAEQRRLLAEPDLTSSQRFLLHFGAAQVLDARGEYAAAAEHLVQGNAWQAADSARRGRKYDRDIYESLAARMIAACTPSFFQRVRGFGLESELPVFVVGLPRSGTTLIEQILASHSKVFGAGEIRFASRTLADFGREGVDPVDGMRTMDGETAQRVAALHLEKLQALAPAAGRIVDKMPENYLHLGMLAALMPRAKFIHCRRDLRDVAVSCWITPFQEVRWASDQDHIVSRFRVYRQIIRHWRQVLPVPMLEVDYEETVEDLGSVARRLIAFCGLEWEEGCLEFHRSNRTVTTASSIQVRQPVYKTSVARWRNYEQSLASLFARLEELT